ncbi:hypothetical protein [Streptomyces sp. NPDC091217]|uniref:hypothetical protein n=1 Tax=Streptomyces sp. NPDC091217 TaxID=3365975 RepID=UPI0037FB4B08
MTRRLPRLRIQVTCWPRYALVLTDTPDPDYSMCEGDGGFEHDYGDYETGEYAGTDWEPCTCWNEQHRWLLLPLPHRPHWLRRGVDPWGPSDYSDEPPF